MPLRAPKDVDPSRLLARLALLGALACAPLAALAQTDDALPRIDAETRVLPVWSNASGRVEALLLLDADASPTTSLDRVLQPGIGLGSRLQLQDGAQLRGSLHLDPDPGLALLCEGRHGLAGSLGALGERCLLATLGGYEDPLLDGAGRGARLELGWQSPNRTLDLSFGLSWLDYTPTPATLLTGAATRSTLGGREFDLAAAFQSPLESRGFHVDSLINLSPQARILLGGELDRSQLIGTDGRPLRWETASLSFGVGYGEFTGQLTGRLVELPQGGNQWSTLDIGLSWRTPWRGELSVGAKNLLGAPDTTAWPLAELPAIEDSDARVPYVRYQQDL
jgi:hypothetical protein